MYGQKMSKFFCYFQSRLGAKAAARCSWAPCGTRPLACGAKWRPTHRWCASAGHTTGPGTCCTCRERACTRPGSPPPWTTNPPVTLTSAPWRAGPATPSAGRSCPASFTSCQRVSIDSNSIFKALKSKLKINHQFLTKKQGFMISLLTEG